MNVVYCWHAQDRHDAPVASTRKLLLDWLAESLAPYRGQSTRRSLCARWWSRAAQASGWPVAIVRDLEEKR